MKTTRKCGMFRKADAKKAAATLRRKGKSVSVVFSHSAVGRGGWCTVVRRKKSRR